MHLQSDWARPSLGSLSRERLAGFVVPVYTSFVSAAPLDRPICPKALYTHVALTVE
jgi:hypothetical protein